MHGEPPLSIEEFEQTLAGYVEILDHLQLNRGQSQVHIRQISKVEAAKPVMMDVIVIRLEQLEFKVNKILKQQANRVADISGSESYTGNSGYGSESCSSGMMIAT